MLLSVLLPTNTLNQLFWDALRSCVGVLPPDSEIVVVVNGDALNSLPKWQSLFETYTRVQVRQSKTPGLVSALNVGLAECNGKYIARMDADDLVCGDRFTRQLLYLQKHPDVKILGGQFMEICEHGATGRRSSLPIRVPGKIFKPSFPKLAHPTVIFDREAILAIGGYRGDFRHAEDHDLWTRALDQYKVRNLRSVVILYRIHASSVSSIYSEEQQINTLKVNLFGLIPQAAQRRHLTKLVDAKKVEELNTFIRSLDDISPMIRLFMYSRLHYWKLVTGISGRVSMQRLSVWEVLLTPVFFITNARQIISRMRQRPAHCPDCE
jgi:Glycosyl transferase family 2